MSITLPEVRKVLMNTPHTLRYLLDGLDEEVHVWRPSANEWSAKQVIGHLIGTDQFIFAPRIKQMIEEDHPTLSSGWDMHQSLVERQDDVKAVSSLLVELMNSRSACLRLLESVQPEQMACTGLHRIGIVSVQDFVFEWAYHDMNHIQQIANNVRAYIYPSMSETMRNAL